MLIKKILNNNIVVTENSDGIEQVVCGRGIAYNKRPGSEIDESQVNQIFVLKSDHQNKRCQEIISSIPLEYIDLADRVIDLIKMDLGKKVNDTIYITLSDHLLTAIERAKEGVNLTNTMLWEIQHYYDVEFTIAKKVLRVIEDSIGIALAEDEAGFIALLL
ncbi:PRD domain-containing protein [Streptococcus sp. S784/96/1]|uniref:PRD domain-containing protein n=1 Tax=Streptococcus sp. S784/96/1 TaxID=2653499 RepID=UPI0013895224|nr:PRD domain-containing protein [Streptococcus sp. S784/96/1]